MIYEEKSQHLTVDNKIGIFLICPLLTIGLILGFYFRNHSGYFSGQSDDLLAAIAKDMLGMLLIYLYLTGLAYALRFKPILHMGMNKLLKAGAILLVIIPAVLIVLHTSGLKAAIDEIDITVSETVVLVFLSVSLFFISATGLAKNKFKFEVKKLYKPSLIVLYATALYLCSIAVAYAIRSL